jgi:hypothetical protein
MTRRRAITVCITAATALYDAAEAAARELGVPMPLRLTPVRSSGGPARPLVAVALSAPEVLHLVHDGFFGALRGRQAAIAAAQACGALPVPALGLPLLQRGQTPLGAEQHVDTLIEREPELHSRGLIPR